MLVSFHVSSYTHINQFYILNSFKINIFKFHKEKYFFKKIRFFFYLRKKLYSKFFFQKNYIWKFILK